MKTHWCGWLLAAALLLSGCAEDVHDPLPAASGGPTTAEYAECLRQHGLVMEQYTAEDGTTQSRPDKRGNDVKKISEATQACRDKLPVDAKSQQQNPLALEDIEARRRYATCLRSKGVPDFPDPDPRTGEFVMDDDLSRRVKENPATRAAMDACRDVFPEATGGVVGG